MEIGRRIGRAARAVVRHTREAVWPQVRWLRRHRSELMAVAALALTLAPLLL